MFIDVKKAHLSPNCEEDVYIELPPECGAPPGMWRAWLYKAGAAAGKLLRSTKSVQDFAAAIYFATTKSGLL